MPASNSMFVTCRRYQQSSTELVVYSRDVKQCVEIAYPVSHATGTRITPSGIASFLRRRRTFWECFCGVVEEHPTPVRFVVTPNGFTKAVCSFCDNRCGFSINLNETCHTAYCFSMYKDWPMPGTFPIPVIAALIMQFELNVTRSPLGYADVAPYFMGYLGALSSIHPLQTSSRIVSLIPGRIDSNRRRHRAVFPSAREEILGRLRHLRQPNTLIVQPQDPVPPAVQHAPALSANEQGHLYALASGMGIDEFDVDGLVEKCDNCRREFIPSALRAHILAGCNER